MNALIDSVIEFQDILENADISCMAIGGIAVSVWGEPRLTRDIDMKVLIHRNDCARLVELLEAYTPLNEEPDKAFRRHGLAFFRDPNGIRINIMLADTVFDEIAIERKTEVSLTTGEKIKVCSTEDLIINKMLSTRIKDRADIESIIQKQGDHLDDGYIEDWLEQFEESLSDSTLLQEFRNLRR
jgi:hypothetical protein